MENTEGSPPSRIESDAGRPRVGATLHGIAHGVDSPNDLMVRGTGADAFMPRVVRSGAPLGFASLDILQNAPVNASNMESIVNTGSNKSSFSRDWPDKPTGRCARLFFHVSDGAGRPDSGSKAENRARRLPNDGIQLGPDPADLVWACPRPRMSRSAFRRIVSC
jgi:hypothetical protein